MPLLLQTLESHTEIVFGQNRYSNSVKDELLPMSGATIDRYLKPTKDASLLKVVTTTTVSPLLQSSIRVRKAGDEVEAVPGFFESDTVAHHDPSLNGEFARTLNLTNVNTGWIYTTSTHNNDSRHIIASLSPA